MENRRGIIDKVKGENFALSRGRSFSRSPGNCGKELVNNPYDFASAYGKLDAYERERESGMAGWATSHVWPIAITRVCSRGVTENYRRE